MKTKSIKTALAVMLCWGAYIGFGADKTNTQTSLLIWTSTNSHALFLESTNFLTISNRAYLILRGATIVRVTDVEWNLITNAYPQAISTNEIHFFK